MDGVKESIHVNLGDANINAITNWSKDKALRKLRKIRQLKGVLNASAKILVTA
jgi:hypothetical protein